MTPNEEFERWAGKEAMRSDLRGRSVRSTGYTAAAGIISFLIRMGSTMVLARLVIPEHFGLLAMVMAVVAFAEQFRDLGLSTATVQAKEISRQQVSNLFWINVGCGAFIALAVAAVAPGLAWFYEDARLLPITLAIAVTPLVGGLAVQHQSLLTRQLKLGRASAVRVLSGLLSVLLAIGLALAGFGYWALVIREVSRSVFVAIGMWISCPWLPSSPRRTPEMKHLLVFGGNLTAANLLGSFVQNLDTVLLGKFFGPMATGFYRQAQYLVSAPVDQIIHPIFRVSEPGLGSLQDEPQRYLNYYRKILSVISLGTMPLSVMLAAYANEFTLILLGEEWMGAANLFRIFCIANFLRPSLWTSHMVLITLGRGKQYLVLKIAENAVFVALVGVGVLYGPAGVAAATPASVLILLLPTLSYCFRDSPLTPGVFWRGIAKPVTASLVMGACLLGIGAALPLESPLATVTLGGAVGVITYLACFCVLPGGARELGGLWSDTTAALGRKRSLPLLGEPKAAQG
jgi:O-antigen/teichoic acid export membrane protein